MHEETPLWPQSYDSSEETILSESASSGGDVLGLSSSSRQGASHGGSIGGLISAEGSAGSGARVSDSVGDDAVSGVQSYTGATHGSGTERSAQ